MKKLIFALFVLVGITSMSYAQTAEDVASTKGSKELATSKIDGKFIFKMPSNVTNENVEQTSKYYTHYFTVNFDASSHNAIITMNENTSKNRYVIARFLTANGVKYLSVDGENLELYVFIEKYLQ